MQNYGTHPIPNLWRVFWKPRNEYLIGPQFIGPRREVAARLKDWIAEQNEDAKAQTLPECCVLRRRHFVLKQVLVSVRTNASAELIGYLV